MPETRGLLTVAAAFGGFFLVLFVVFKVLNSEFFRGDPELGGSARPVANAGTAAAEAHCRQRANELLHLPAGAADARPEVTAWDLGFGRYLVKSSAAAGGPGAGRGYVCKILDEGARWTVQSIDFLD